MIAIFKRELKSYLITPLGYVFSGVFLAAAALIFHINNVLTRSSELSAYFSMLSYLWLLLCPVLVMRLIAGERKQMTDQLLLTAPVKPQAIVLGKFLAACTMLLLTAMLSGFYPLLLGLFGQAHMPEVMTAYLGFILMGCAFVSLDLLISAFFRNPNSALVFGIGANLVLWLSSLMAPDAPGLLRALLSLVNLYDRLTPFLHAQLSPANILYYAAFCLSCLACATWLVNARNWSEAL